MVTYNHIVVVVFFLFMYQLCMFGILIQKPKQNTRLLPLRVILPCFSFLFKQMKTKKNIILAGSMLWQMKNIFIFIFFCNNTIDHAQAICEYHSYRVNDTNPDHNNIYFKWCVWFIDCSIFLFFRLCFRSHHHEYIYMLVTIIIVLSYELHDNRLCLCVCVWVFCRIERDIGGGGDQYPLKIGFIYIISFIQ